MTLSYLGVVAHIQATVTVSKYPTEIKSNTELVIIQVDQVNPVGMVYGEKTLARVGEARYRPRRRAVKKVVKVVEVFT